MDAKLRAFDWRPFFLYSIGTLLFTLLQYFGLNHIQIWLTIPFIIPILPAVFSTWTGYKDGALYSLVLGFFCDRILTSGPTSWFYMITFTIVALLSAIVSRFALKSGYLSSFINSAISFGVLALFRLTIYLIQGNSPLTILWIAIKECVLSIPFSFLVCFSFKLVKKHFYF